MSHHLDQRVQESLLGVQIGDAMGMPVEMMKPDEILEATDGKGVTGFMDCIQSRIDDTRGLKSGETTDDWQLTKAVARSLISMGDYDQHDMAKRHIAEFLGDNRGWGGTTRRGIQSLIDGRDPFELQDMPKPGRGCGNGVAMKIAPIGLFYGIRCGEFRRHPLLEKVMDNGKLTHPDIRAAISAYAIAAGIAWLMHHPIHQAGGWTMNRQKEAFAKFVIDEVCAAEEEYNDNSPLEDSVSYRIDRACKLIDDPVELRETVGTGCISVESIPFTIATFLRHPTNYTEGMLEAINAGGDTDSTASMFGALIGANGGGQTYTGRCVPLTWKDELPDKGAEAMRLGADLFKAAKI